MELDFDKEMDALLRQTAKTDAFVTTNGAGTAAHIDADAISAFAENALPEKTRALYMTHLADCDRCRKILSNLIALNSEPWPPATSAIETPEIAIAPVPWYRKLFAFPQLAYVMGALVLVFGGMIGFLVVQNRLNKGPEITQVRDNEMPAAAPYKPDSSSTANSALPAANTAANTNASVSLDNRLQTGQAFDTNTVSGYSADGPGATGNKAGEESRAASMSATEATPPVENDLLRTRDEAISQPRDPGALAREDQKKSEQKEAPKAAEPTATLANPAPPPPPPAKRAQQPLGGVPSVKDADREKGDASGSSSGKRQLGGKSFSRSGGVWYDSAYNGRATTDVRRGTDQYRKLDPGLRNIADNLGGTVVIVWAGKAYRIQ